MTSKGTDDVERGKANSPRWTLLLFAWICAYRLANAWVIRTQFDPDEYWQTLEPAYCLAFGAMDDSDAPTHSATHQDGQRMHGCALTWEWTRRWSPSASSDEIQSALSTAEKVRGAVRTTAEQALHGPVRSYVSILPTYWYYLGCRSLFRWADGNEVDAHREGIASCTRLRQFVRRHATYLVSKGPALLHAILVAAPTDLSVWLIASRMQAVQCPATDNIGSRHSGYNWKSWPFWALACSITSWFHGYALVRTYANSVETACLMVGIALLGPELFGQSAKVGSSRQRARGLWAKLAFVLGGLSVCVRFTSLAAWIPVGLIVAVRSGTDGHKKANAYSYRTMLQTLVGTCATYGAIGVVLGCCIDRWFYGFWAIPILGNIHFNVLLGNGALYGTHPLLWYIYAGLPAICGATLPLFLWDIKVICVEKGHHPARDNPRLVLLGIIAPYIVLHSLSEHKEFRFLLPMLPLICILAGHTLARLASVAEEATINTVGIDSRREYREEKTQPPKSQRIKKFLTSPWVLLVGLLLLNYPHLLYLATIHQRGPIAVNLHLSSIIQKVARLRSERDERWGTQQYSIHYLMGCHAAPVYSHLHVPNVRVDAWHLDCSPDCRSNPDAVCESDAFSNDPLGFVTSTYGLLGDESCDEAGSVKEPPHLLVVMQDDAVAIDPVLTRELNMSHAGSIRHTVKSISWHSTDDQCASGDRCHDVVTLFSLVDVHFDHMKIYAYRL